MNIDLLLHQLSCIFSEQDLVTVDSVKVMKKIRDILNNRALKLEQRCNQLEMCLIEIVNTETNQSLNIKAQLAVKVVLFSRNLPTDIPGRLEKMLLLESYGEPGEDSPVTRLGSYFINKISLEISRCLDSKETGIARIQAALHLLARLCEEHTDRELTHLKFWRDKCREHLLYSSVIEHSVWASACLESLTYLQQLSLSETRDKLGGNETLKNKQIAAQAALHLGRARYFVQRSEERLEDIGKYVGGQLAFFEALCKETEDPSQPMLVILQPSVPVYESPANLKLQYIASHQAILAENAALLSEAYEIIINYKASGRNFSRLLDIALKLKKNKNHFATFIEVVALTLSSHLSEDRWKHYLVQLQDTVVPINWRVRVCEIWLSLADHFNECQDEEHPHYQACARSCIKQISEKWGKEASLMAKIKLAMMDKDDKLGLLQDELNDHSRSAAVVAKEYSDFDYPLENQFTLVQYLSQLGAHDIAQKNDSCQSVPIGDESTARECAQYRVNVFKSLLVEDYVFGLKIVCQLLADKDDPDYPHVCEAVQNVYDIKHTNPLKLSEKLRLQNFNGYWMLWARIYANALKNGFLQEHISRWRDLKFSDIDITNKLLGKVHRQLYTAIFDKNVILQGAEEYLEEVDQRLIEVNLELAMQITNDADSKLFCSLRLTVGLFEAVIADMAARANNAVLQEHFAKLSIFKVNAKPSTASTEEAQQELSKSVTLSARPASTLIAIPVSLPTLKKNSKPDSSAPECFDGVSITEKTGSGRSVEKRRPTSIRDFFQGASAESSPDVSTVHIPRVASAQSLSNNSAETQTPSPKFCRLGSFHYALSTWTLYLEHNTDRDPDLVQRFKENLANASNPDSPNKQERCYIMALIWLKYFHGRDRLWITDEAFLKLEAKAAKFSPEKYNLRSQPPIDARDFLINRKVMSFLERAMEGDMFPPAIMTYTNEIYTWFGECYDHRRDRVDNFILKCIRYCEEAIVQHGYLPALYSYALLVKNNSSFFKGQGSRADILTKVVAYCYSSERFVDIDLGQIKDYIESIKVVKRLDDLTAIGRVVNGETAESVLDDMGYLNNNRQECALEKPLPLIPSVVNQLACSFQLNEIPVTVSYTLGSKESQFNSAKLSSFFADLKSPVEGSLESGNFCFQISSTTQENSTRLQDHFCSVEKWYRHTKKVHFSQPVIVLRPGSSVIEVTHADIAVLGLLRIYAMHLRSSEQRLPDTEIEPLLHFLELVSELLSKSWQWETAQAALSRVLKELKLNTAKQNLPLSQNRLLSDSGSVRPRVSSDNGVSKNIPVIASKNQDSDPGPILLDLSAVPCLNNCYADPAPLDLQASVDSSSLPQLLARTKNERVATPPPRRPRGLSSPAMFSKLPNTQETSGARSPRGTPLPPLALDLPTANEANEVRSPRGAPLPSMALDLSKVNEANAARSPHGAPSLSMTVDLPARKDRIGTQSPRRGSSSSIVASGQAEELRSPRGGSASSIVLDRQTNNEVRSPRSSSPPSSTETTLSSAGRITVLGSSPRATFKLPAKKTTQNASITTIPTLIKE